MGTRELIPLWMCAGIIALLPGAAATIAAETTNRPPTAFAYVLQAEALGASRGEAVKRLAECGRDWIIIDTTFANGDEAPWMRDEIARIRAGRPGRKVLAYLSIGEAEDYRPYWRSAWDTNRDGRPDAAAPLWLWAENPEWKGNYKVRYWRDDWQRLTLRRVEQAMQQGFDGLYLDIVDAFEFFEETEGDSGGVNPDTGHTFRADMISWVRHIAAQARAQRPGALIVPQNGAQLLEDKDYLAAIDAIGIEDLFTDGDTLQEMGHTADVLGVLKRATRKGKPVLLIEYGTKPGIVRRSVQGARANGLVLLVTDRALKTLGQAPGTDTNRAEPEGSSFSSARDR